MAKLTKKDVFEILRSESSVKSLVEKFGVTRSGIFKIRNGEIHTAIYDEYVEKHGKPNRINTPKRKRLDRDQVYYVLGTQDATSTICQKLEINSTQVGRIRSGKAFKEYYEDYCREFGDPVANKSKQKGSLKRQEVIDILKSSESTAVLAERYGVTKEAIINVRSGRSHWKVQQEFTSQIIENNAGLPPIEVTQLNEGKRRRVEVAAAILKPRKPLITRAWV